MEYLKLIWVFLKIGAVSYGGGWTIVGLIQNEVIQNGWLTISEFNSLLAIAQVTPGPLALNAATLVGFKLLGISGAIAATLAVVFIPVVSIVLILLFASKLIKKSLTLRFSLRLGTICLLGMTLFASLMSFNFNAESILIAVTAFGIAAFTKINPVYVILGAGFVNAIFSLFIV